MREYARAGILVLSLLAALAGPAGCKTTTPAAKPAESTDAKTRPEGSLMSKARVERDAGRYDEALLALAQQERANRDEPGLEDLRTSILDKILRLREKELKPALPQHVKKINQEVDENKLVPSSYGTRRVIEAPNAVIRTPDNKAEAMLSLPVSMTLEGADLTTFIMGLTQSASANRAINIIADDAISGDLKLTMNVTNVPLREVLDYASRNLEVSFYVGENMIWCSKRTKSVDSVPMSTRLYKLRKGITSLETAGDDGQGIGLMAAIDKFVPKDSGGEIMFDRDSHVLIAKNSRDNLRLIEDLIEALDVIPPQVLIEARFISTGISDLRELGVNWNTTELEFRTGHDTYPQALLKGGNIIQTGKVATPTLDASLAYQGLLSTPMFNVIIQALEQSGKSETLSVPRVTTLNNQPAKIRVGEDFLYFENFSLQQVPTTVLSGSTPVTQYGSQLVPEGEPTKEELGISLEVTPSVGADRKTVTLTLKPEINEFVRWEQYDVASDTSSGANVGGVTNGGLSVLKLPIFRKSEVETKVAVHSGETVVMGGLITSSQGNDSKRVPILGSIPFLGALFRHDQKTKEQKNLLIFVTARILAETGEELVPLTPAEMPFAAK
jgi:type II secretory pathway component GspD/PulD (secretin)